MFFQRVDRAVAENTDIRNLLQLPAKCQYLRISFARSIFQANNYIAHRHSSTILTLCSQQKELAKQVARSPVVLEELYEVSTPADVIRNNAPMTSNLLVIPQTYLNQQDLRRHRGGFIRLCYGVVTSLAI
jgi:glutamine synthetase adenylyltransferase